MEKLDSKHTIEHHNSALPALQLDSYAPGNRHTSAGYRETREFAMGLAAGMVNTLEDCIDFIAKPEVMAKTVVGVCSAVDNAGNYYAGKISQNRINDIGRDSMIAWNAGKDWLAAYPKKPARERGEIMGELGTQLLACEIGAGLLKTGFSYMGKAVKFEELAARDPEYAVRIRDKASVPRTEEIAQPSTTRLYQWGGSAEFRNSVQTAVDQLPDGIKQILRERNISINCVDMMSDMSVRATPSTRGMFMPHLKSIFIAERFQRGGNWIAELGTTNRILQHEIAHMLDDMDKTGVRLSDARMIGDSYAQDIKSLSGVQKNVLGYYAGGSDLGRREVFAEAYAILRSTPSPVDGMWRTYFQKSFAKTVQAVKDSQLP